MTNAYQHLFGPVPSRRLGLSLGVDLTPFKTCTLDCVFCQLGRTTAKTAERREYVPTHEVTDELERWLAAGGRADYVTLAGTGEPTLHSHFGDVIEAVRRKSAIPVALLTNGTMLHLPEVREAAAAAHLVKISLSAWDQESYERINRPHPKLPFSELVEGQARFRRRYTGELWLEVFVVSGLNSAAGDLRRIAELATRIGPDRVQLNTAVRPPAEPYALPLPQDQLEALSNVFSPKAEVIAEFSTGNAPALAANENTVLAMLARRPCTTPQVADAFGMHPNEVSKYIGKLVRTGRARSRRVGADIYYEQATREPCPMPAPEVKDAQWS